jgi:hypothetical protein
MHAVHDIHSNSEIGRALSAATAASAIHLAIQIRARRLGIPGVVDLQLGLLGAATQAANLADTAAGSLTVLDRTDA